MLVDFQETTEWEKWFAWRPVIVSRRWFVLWETIERRKYRGEYAYRLPQE